MYVILRCCFAAMLVTQSTALSSEVPSDEIQYFVDRGWHFECRRSDEGHVVRAVCACQIEESRAMEFLGSLPEMEQISIALSTFEPGDVRSLAQRCPSLSAVHVTGEPFQRLGRFLPVAQPLKAEIWPELMEFRNLKRLSVENLYCSGDVEWADPRRTDLETLEVSGNLSGMLATLLAPCKVRSLGIRFNGGPQQLMDGDIATLNSHPEIESLAIHGSPFAANVFVDLDALSGLWGLRQLTLEQCSIDPQSLHRLRLLEKLSLQRCQFVKHGFDALLAHSTLEKLVLSECSNELLRIGELPATAPKSLREITIRAPVFEEIGAFSKLPCSYHVELCPCCCFLADKASRRLEWFGTDEVAVLMTLKGLRSVSIDRGFETCEVSEAALVGLAHIDTLRSLELLDVAIVENEAPGKLASASGLEEVRLVTATPLNQELVMKLLGPNTHAVFLGDYSGDPQPAHQSNDVFQIKPRQVGLTEVTLPVLAISSYGRLLTSSVEDLVLDSCYLNKGAVQQLVSTVPSLKRLTLRMCQLEDEQELLHANQFNHLRWIDFTHTTVSARAAMALEADVVRFGEGWQAGGSGVGSEDGPD